MKKNIKIDEIVISEYISSGNNKVPRTTAIFNMGPAIECPSFKLGFCQAFRNGKHVCYAKKAERGCYPDVLPSRIRQKNYWKKISSKKFANDFILLNSLKTKKYIALRFNESGDFWSQKCLNKAENIAKILSEHNVKVYCYSSRKDLDFSKIKYLIVSGSNFKKEGIKNIFKMIQKNEKVPKGYEICPGNCKICNRCMQKNKKLLLLVIDR